jgi:lambda family phage portal protein
MNARVQLTAFDRFIAYFSPISGVHRAHARAVLRHYEAASAGRRTASHQRPGSSADVASRYALGALRNAARDLHRNNGWARRGIQAIGNNTVGWGIVPTSPSETLNDAWNAWSETTSCDVGEALSFAGIQRLSVDTVAAAGEVLVRRHELGAGLQLELLEPDYIDTSKGKFGLEYEGKRIKGYWLFDKHPGAGEAGRGSAFVDRSHVAHVRLIERPGQVRGVSWLAAAVMRLKDFDEYEDALLMRQKIAACFAAFVKDVEGQGSPIGDVSGSSPALEYLEPGQIHYLKAGEDITFGTPPQASDNGDFSKTTLRAIAAALGVTYEDLSGDYSQVNFSSARMSRLAHWQNVYHWRWNMLVPQLCQRVWQWFVEWQRVTGASAPALSAGGLVSSVQWTGPPMPMIEPDREGLALRRLVRTGAMTPSEMVRERGGDPKSHWDEYQRDMEDLDKRGIVLDCDPRKTSDAGLTQQRAGVGTDGAAADPKEGEEEEA